MDSDWIKYSTDNILAAFISCLLQYNKKNGMITGSSYHKTGFILPAEHVVG